MSLLPPEPIFVEKRLLPRWKIAAQAKIKWQNFKDYLNCEVMDLNMKGFCLSSPEKILDYNTRAELYFNEKYFFEVGISVTWHKEIEEKQVYGIKFLKVRDYDREKIYQMMKENFASHLIKCM